MASKKSEVLQSLFGHPKNCRNPNIYVQLPLSFGLLDVNFVVKPSISNSTQDEDISIKNIIYTLIYKIINILIFFSIDFLNSKFKLTKIF